LGRDLGSPDHKIAIFLETIPENRVKSAQVFFDFINIINALNNQAMLPHFFG